MIDAIHEKETLDFCLCIPGIAETFECECEDDRFYESKDSCHTFPDLGIIPEFCDSHASERLWHERLELIGCWSWNDRLDAHNDAEAALADGMTGKYKDVKCNVIRGVMRVSQTSYSNVLNLFSISCVDPVRAISIQRMCPLQSSFGLCFSSLNSFCKISLLLFT